VLVRDLLDYARTRLGDELPITVETTNMARLCAQSVDEAEAAHPGHTIATRFSGDMAGKWDPVRTGQLFTNLLTNAMIHGDHDAAVSVAVMGAADTVSIEVHNDGPPIPESARASLFEPLYRATNHSTRHVREGSSGLGLGLYIARQIALAHGGDIEVTSTQESGTTFRVILPRNPL
jgi:signal transduction histidine kinase